MRARACNLRPSLPKGLGPAQNPCLNNTWYTVDKLQGRPESVELRAFVDVDDPVGWRLPMPDSVLEEALDPVEDDLEDAEAAAQPLPGEQVALPRNLSLLSCPEFLDIWHNLQS